MKEAVCQATLSLNSKKNETVAKFLLSVKSGAKRNGKAWRQVRCAHHGVRPKGMNQFNCYELRASVSRFSFRSAASNRPRRLIYDFMPHLHSKDPLHPVQPPKNLLLFLLTKKLDHPMNYVNF